MFGSLMKKLRERKMVPKKSKSEAKNGVDGSLRSIFMHADCVDMWLMALGFIGAVLDGFTDRIPFLFVSHMINSIGSLSSLDLDSFR